MSVTRVTQNAIFQTTRNILQQQQRRLFDAQEVVSTQKRINRLSDDPLGAGQVVSLRGELSQVVQFQRNIGRATTLAEAYDTALGQANDILTRARELVLSQSSTATTSEQTREAVAIELISLREQLVSIANSRIGGKYIFAGHRDSTEPFTEASVMASVGGGNTGTGVVASSIVTDVTEVTGDDHQIVFTSSTTFDIVNTTQGVTVSSGNTFTPGGNIAFEGISVQITGAPAAGDVFDMAVELPGVYRGDSGQVRLEIEQDILATVNLTGDAVFQGVGSAGGENLFDVFNDVVSALRSDDEAGIVATLDRLDAAQDQIVGHQAIVGARENQLDTTSLRLADLELNLQSLISSIEDVDVTEAITNFTQAENAYQASLGAASRMIQPSLLDFLA